MISRKGMSQTLTLIVAASVLMMTALSVIFMVQGGLGDVSSGTSVSACKNAVSFQCRNTDSLDTLPSSCTNSEGDVKEEISKAVQGNLKTNACSVWG